MIQSLQVAYEPPMQAMHAGKSISANEQIASHPSITAAHDRPVRKSQSSMWAE